MTSSERVPPKLFSNELTYQNLRCFEIVRILTSNIIKVQYSYAYIYSINKGVWMLLIIAVVLIVLWLLGFIAHVGGSFIHLLLVIALIVIIVNFIRGRKAL
jgi:hypothetical protein